MCYILRSESLVRFIWITGFGTGYGPIISHCVVGGDNEFDDRSPVSL
jgi:hypothetical protein